MIKKTVSSNNTLSLSKLCSEKKCYYSCFKAELTFFKIIAWESINDHSQPSEVAPIDMDTTANPWESAGAASSPTPGMI